LEVVFLFFYAVRLLPEKPRFVGKLAIMTVAASAILYLASLPENPVIKAAVFTVTLILFGLVSWWWGLKQSERVFLAGAATGASAKIRTNCLPPG
jgi:hypothetical protein